MRGLALCISFTLLLPTLTHAARPGKCASCHDTSAFFRTSEDAVSALMKGGLKPGATNLRGEVVAVIDPVLRPIPEEQLALKPDIYAVVPHTDASYQNVFKLPGHKITIAERVEVEEARLNLAFTYRQKIHFASASDSGSDLESFIRNSTSDHVIILGHNEKGLLRLPNGETVALQKLDQICSSSGKRCFFISCSSNAYLTTSSGVTASLNFTEASEVSFYLDRYLVTSRLNGWSKVMLDQQLKKFVVDAKLETGKEIVTANFGKAVLVVGLAGVYELATKKSGAPQ
jgi:hypothetical protein